MTRTLVLNEDGIEALNALLKYNWADERDDFLAHEGERDCHIFTSMVQLANLIDQTNYTPEEAATAA